MRTLRAALCAFAFAAPSALAAQVIDLTIHDVGIAIGDKPRMTGLRLNFRDAHLDRVTGVNATIWGPYMPATGTVVGLALGLPSTGADRIRGLAAGVLGVGAGTSISGLGVGGIGLGGGGDLRGIMLGGIGVGSGGSVDGITLGGIGVGAGGRLRGIQIGGIGVGSGRDVTGISIGGIGVGAGGMLKGLATPIAAGGLNVHALVISGLYFKVEDAGRFDGAAVSSVTYIKGAQHGITIGLFNYANELHGAQVGILNISDNDGHRRVLPVLSIR